MSDLPSNWEWVRLDDVAEVRLGRQRSPKNHSGTHMRPYLRAANVGWEGLKLEDVKHMNFNDAELAIYRLVPGDIVVAEASGSPGEVGKPALWQGEIEDCCFQNTLIRVRSYGVEPKYLLHYLRAEALRGAFVEESRGVGISHLGASRLSGWPIAVPPLSEQRRIVAALEDHLSRLEVGIAGLLSSSARLEPLIYSVRKRALLSGDISWGKLRDVVLRIEAGKSFSAQGRPASSDEWGILKVSAMTWGHFRESENKALHPGQEFDPKHEVRVGDILVSRANTEKYVGAPVLVQSTRPRLLLSDKSLRLIPKSGINPNWLIEVLSSPIVREQISKRATGTKDAMRNISQNALLDIDIPIVPPGRQSRLAELIHSQISEIDRMADSITRTRRSSERLCGSLLADAFSGRLVLQNSSDEPASVLLQKIKTARAITTRVRRSQSIDTKIDKVNSVQESLL